MTEPEWHVHRGEEALRCEQMLLGAVVVARAEVQPADPQVAACEQGPHPELCGQRDGIQIVVLGLLDADAVARGGLAQHVKQRGYIPALTSLTGEAQRPLSHRRSLV